MIANERSNTYPPLEVKGNGYKQVKFTVQP